MPSAGADATLDKLIGLTEQLESHGQLLAIKWFSQKSLDQVSHQDPPQSPSPMFYDNYVVSY